MIELQLAGNGAYLVMIRGGDISGFDLLGLLLMAAVTLGAARLFMSRRKP